MLSPLDLIKGYFSFKSYFTWFLLASTIFGIFIFFKRKYNETKGIKKRKQLKPTSNLYIHTSWKGYLIYFLIIIIILVFGYLCFFYKPKDPSSKYVGQLINEIDKAIDKYDQTINDYKGLKSDWEGELKKCEKELKTLYEKQKINQKQKEKIKKLLDQTELKITDIKTQQQENEKNISELKEQLKEKEQELKNKEKEKKLTEEQIANSTNLSEIEKLNIKLTQINKEISSLVAQISHLNSQIGILESRKEMYEGMLSDAIEIKDSIQRDYDKLSSGEQKLFSEIKSEEERKTEIQKNIDEINQKLNKIESERDLYNALKEKYGEMHNRMTTYEKENEFSFGNAFKFGFKGFDKVTDLFPATYAVKTLGKTISVTRKFAQGVGKVGIVLHEGHRLWHMYNEVVNENKESAPMITKETLDSYLNDIDRDLAKLDADKKDYEKKIEEYKNRRENDKILRDEIFNETSQIVEFKNKKQSVIAEYRKIINELDEKRKKIEDIDKLRIDKFALETDKLEFKIKERDIIREEIRQQNPNYARAQQRLKDKRQTKIPELIPIPNK
ncbi:DNA double-strand break repair protein Rad50 [Candidatus Phytoplasma rubi]|uniref:DNA double-strand break repair protein Rad50 n=1 Tax=Candidatus Phytoplasma rubi TaxID=399025 RepID=A0ABY7BRQ7_9MOLU|nr:DNA double-strand break repair protein Rad50 [Candidatus Phytoplasma rubi]WAN63362.1 DNA double-strand break repair protein Rad50 [Candidatus Phytoplasma rubi]